MHIPRPIYKMKQHKGIILALLLIILPSASLLSLKSVVAAPTYTITPAAPGRIQEGQSIALTLSVTGLTPTTQYIFFINVTQPDPSGMHSTQITLMTDSGGAASGIKTYPVDFTLPTAASTNFVGTYNIVVQEASPVPTLNVATASFTVGLTDKTTYQRTNTVLIQASGYANNEAVTVDISTNGGTTHANGFPTVVHASSTGIIFASWVIPYSTQLGTWTVSASGASTLKAPTDQQTITINIAAFLVTVSTDPKIYARTQTITAYATVQYPNGTVLGGITPSTPSGSPPGSYPYVYATFRNGSVFRVMTWNATAQNWYATYTVPANLNNPSTLPQLWNIQVTATDNWGNAASGQWSVTIQLVPPGFNLQITARNSTEYLANVYINITYGNGTVATSGLTDATGNAFFTLPEGDSYSYVIVASLNGYDDYPDSFFLQGNLMHRTYRMSNVYYSGSILSGSYTTAAHYNPGDSGSLVVWMYNQNTTFPIFITKIVVEFPWYNTYGNAYLGNASIPLPANGQQILPKTNWNTTITFTVPNDGRLYSGVGGSIYISARVTAWKNVWTISSTGELVGSQVLDSNTFVDAKANPIYAGQGFLTFDRISISFATQDTGLAGQLTIMEILMGFFVVNVALLVLIWMRLKPVSHTGVMPKA